MENESIIKLFMLLLTIMGAGISMLLLVNAHFTRRTLEKISTVELRLVELIQKHDATDERSRSNKSEIDKMRDRLHYLEGELRQAIKVAQDLMNEKKPGN